MALIRATAIALAISCAAAITGSTQTIEAYEAANSAALAAWRAMPLTVRNAGFVTEAPTGYGTQNPREGTRFYPAEPVIIYAELLGYHWREYGNNTVSFSIAIDVVIRDGTGQIVLERENVETVTTTSRHRNREMFTTLTLNMRTAPVGDYSVEYALRDLVGGQRVSVALPFSLASP